MPALAKLGAMRWLAAIAIVGLALGTGLWWGLSRTAVPAQHPSGAPKLRVGQEARHADAPSASTADLSEHLHRLIDAANQGDAQSAYQASTLLEQCWVADFVAGPVPDRIENAQAPQTQTDFMREQIRMRDQCKNIPTAIRADRFRLVRIAALARIPGAAYAFARMGPPAGADALETQRDDPGVSMWRQEAEGFLKEAAAAGDLESMYVLSTNYQMGIYTQQDPVAALAYAYAYASRQEMLDGTKISPGYARLLDVLSRGLSAEQQRTAQEQGTAIAAASPLPQPRQSQ